jgi:hypothetical protein
MKALRFFWVFVFASCSFGSYAQKVQAKVAMNSSSDKVGQIVYRKGQLLRIKDFEGSEEKEMRAIAMTYSGVSLNYSAAIKADQIFLNINLCPTFDKEKSWFLEEHKNQRTLDHEQLHFDITVINACALYKALKAFSFSSKFEKEIVELQAKYRTQNEALQDLYDSETNNGIHKEKQAEWYEKIKKQLADCNDCYE